MHWSSKNC